MAESIIKKMESLNLSSKERSAVSGYLRRLKISKKFWKIPESSHVVIFDEDDKLPLVLKRKDMDCENFFVFDKCMDNDAIQSVVDNKDYAE